MSKWSSGNSDTQTEEFLLWKKKKDNVGLYLKGDYKTRDVGPLLWPHFLEQGGT